jgi:hypothetical protein
MECGWDKDGNNRNQEQRSIELSSGRFDSLFCEPNTSSEKAPAISYLSSLLEGSKLTFLGRAVDYSGSTRPMKIGQLPIRI